MSKIYKIEEADSRPLSPSNNVLYLIKRFADSIRRRKAEYYDGSRWIALDSMTWLNGGGSTGSTSSLPSVDISHFNDASEFMAVVTFYASSAYQVSVAVVIPNTPVGGMAANKQDYMLGYHYDSSYNGSILVRWNSNNGTISVVSGFTKITGNAQNDEVKLSIYYR